jgi:hypothetical protein
VSGIPGGIFSPSLAVGAGLAWRGVPVTPVGAVLLLAMVAYFSGVVQAPITAFVIVLQQRHDRAADRRRTARVIGTPAIYHALSREFPRRHAGDG